MLRVDGVDVFVEGTGTETVLMVHGWPDTHRLWDSTVAALGARRRCVRFTLPGFDAAHPRRMYTVDDLVAFLQAVADRVSPDRPLTLLAHDWGCILGYEFAMRHPARVARIVGVDIGDPGSLRRSMRPRAKCYVLGYQVWLAAAWKIGGRTGDAMTRSMARRARRPAHDGLVASRMNYLYFLSWFGGAQAVRHHVQRSSPRVPMLFAYGRRKPFPFHSPQWLDELRSSPANHVEPFDTGHWVMLEEPGRFNAVVEAWLDATPA